jgi:hypothetical protein
MSIKHYRVRTITDENRGQPIISQAVEHGNVVYLMLQETSISGLDSSASR